MSVMWHPPIRPFVDEPQQPLHAVAADAGNNAELGHVSPDRIDPRTDECPLWGEKRT